MRRENKLILCLITILVAGTVLGFMYLSPAKAAPSRTVLSAGKTFNTKLKQLTDPAGDWSIDDTTVISISVVDMEFPSETELQDAGEATKVYARVAHFGSGDTDSDYMPYLYTENAYSGTLDVSYTIERPFG